ncbi:MAG: hypothetical protein ACLFMS_08170 [Halorhodospira sp.]
MADQLESLRRLFDNLDMWRHLPSYRLEPRADPFFGLYMREVVAAHLQVDLHDVMVPELPLRLGTIGCADGQGDNQSVKVDFALFSQARDKMYLVELKTDQASHRDQQDQYLERAADTNGNAIIEGILALPEPSKQREKYRYLLRELARLGAISVPDGMMTASGPELTRMMRDQTRINLSETTMHVKVGYVQPTLEPRPETADFVIDFKEFGHHLPVDTDAVAAMFQSYLEQWTGPAGASQAVGA